jgi:adenylate cyclase 10
MNESDLLAISTPRGLQRCNDVMQAVQEAIYRFEGSINKFLMDDKGSTLIAVFGLPPLAHEDDATRAILSSMSVCAKLQGLGFCPSVGITTGIAFCGVVGSRGSRREYTVLGDMVNLSARLMQYSTVHGGGIVVDDATMNASANRVFFERLEPISVKGKAQPVKIFHPYPLWYVSLTC